MLRLQGIGRGALLLLTVSVCWACAGAPPPASDTASVEERLARLGVRRADLVDPAAVDDEIVGWARERVRISAAPGETALRLLDAIVGEEGLALEYDRDFNGTALEVFRARRANCLAFTHLFVGLGRALGLPVYYVGFRQSPRFRKEGDLVLAWEHVTAGVTDERQDVILQYTVGPEIDYSGAVPLSDLTALAMHYSNRGAEHLRNDDPEGAARALEIAVALDPWWAQAMVNLGVARRRLGDLEGAEEAYQRALSLEAENVRAFGNLAVLYRLLGRHDVAKELLGLADRHGTRDPFVFLALGDTSLAAGERAEARRFYRRAVRLASDDGEPAAAMGILEWRESRPARARRWLRRAEKLSPDNPRIDRLRRMLRAAADESGSASETPDSADPDALDLRLE